MALSPDFFAACYLFATVLFIMGLIYPKAVVTDLKAELAEVKQDRDQQRERADTAVTALQGTKDVLAAIQFGRNLEAGRGS